MRSVSDVVIRAEGLGKRYRIGREEVAYKTLRESLTGLALAPARKLRAVAQRRGARREADTIWALRNVDLEVRQGEVLGIIGGNGAGKSTLLKILSRITRPTEGRAELQGRVGSLLEVGTGFHPELTGRENIYLNGAILGMSRAEIRTKLDQIVDFSGVRSFIDTPVKRYSSGMQVRLAFAVAAHLDTEILLLDEVLAVGDAAFQRKCLGRIEHVASGGRTVLFVSHNMAAIQGLCDRCLLLSQGRAIEEGSTADVVRQYLAQDHDVAVDVAARGDRGGDGSVRITSFQVREARSGDVLTAITSGTDVLLEIGYSSVEAKSLRRANLGIALYTALGQFLAVLNSEMAQRAFETLPAMGTLRCRVPRFPVMCGDIRVTLTLRVGGALVDQVQDAAVLHVEPGDFFGTGISNDFGRQGVYMPHTWELATEDVAEASGNAERHGHGS